MIKISIIVAVYNVEKYLHECINSLIGQTLRDIEIIVVDDGSYDKTQELMEEYLRQDTRISYVKIRNKGLGAARNTGIQRAKGEYLGFIDGDDFADKQMYSYMYRLAKQKNIDIVSCLHTCFWDDQLWEEYSYPYYPFNTNEKCFEANALNKYEALLNYSSCNKIFKRSIFKLFPENLLHEDIPVMFDLFSSKHSILLINNPFHFYRQGRPGKITEDNSEKRFDIFKISATVERCIKQKKLNQGWTDFFLNWRNQYYLSIYKKIRPSLRKKFLIQVKKELHSNNVNFIRYVKKINKRKIRSFFLFYGLIFFLNFFSAMDKIFFHGKNGYKKHIMPRFNHD